MSDAPNDSEFVEIATAIEPAPGEAAATETPQQPADGEHPQGDDGEADKPQDGEKPEGEDGEKPSDQEPLRDDKGKFKSGAEARIAEITRLRREAERSRDYWKGIATHNGAKPGDNAAPTSKPTADDYEDYGEYVEALTDWKVADRERQNASKNAETAASTVETHRAEEWGAKIGEAKSVLPDFDAVMDKADTPTADHVAQAIMDADRGPELLYHLAKHPELVGKLNDMSPNRAAMELGRIEATLAAPAERPKPRDTTQTKAPSPITPVKSGSTTAKDPAKMDMDEYKAYRQDQGIR